MALSIAAIIFFLLVAEGMTRVYDKYFSDKKIDVVMDDGGSRLSDYTFEKKPGIFRILVLGDSIAYGQGVHKSKTFSKQIEDMLNGNSDNRKFEVINTGFYGYDTNQELGILLNEGPDALHRPELSGEGFQGLAYKPDMILLEYTVQNDAVYYGPGALELHRPHRWKDGSEDLTMATMRFRFPKGLTGG